MVQIIDTTFRDAHQSLLATRLRTEDMLKIARVMDEIGFYSMEVWGGATFDVCIRYLGEDPWERLRLLREEIRRTKLQMLLRGKNLVGYRHYPEDVVRKFIEKAFENGIDIFRIFDALNDIENMEVAIRSAKAVGAEVQGVIVYTTGPMFTLEYYLSKAEELMSRDVDVITIKDMAGLLDPYTAYELVREIKREYGIPVNVHTHSTTGMAVATYLKAVEGGADFIDTSISPLAFGTAQPGIQTVQYVLKLNLKSEKIKEVSEYLEKLLDGKYNIDKKVIAVNPYVLEYQVPGGMLSNLIAQLKEMRALHRLKDVLREIPRVREDLGWPPLVTPMSQIVGTQALLNVLFGRYKRLTREVKAYIKGKYGKPPGRINPKLVEMVRDFEVDDDSLTFEEARRKLIEMGFLKEAQKDENVLTYALFPQIAKEFFEGKVREDSRRKVFKKLKLLINGVEYEVGILSDDVD
ncbi:pyruvate carboxylase subunit B [Pyrococcus sp. NA2]|nr:pyruvate carboxylase subunit B [Pyrococcus sp. NA2]